MAPMILVRNPLLTFIPQSPDQKFILGLYFQMQISLFGCLGLAPSRSIVILISLFGKLSALATFGLGRREFPGG
jgi:hypothetical protein